MGGEYYGVAWATKDITPNLNPPPSRGRKLFYSSSSFLVSSFASNGPTS